MVPTTMAGHPRLDVSPRQTAGRAIIEKMTNLVFRGYAAGVKLGEQQVWE
jgi:hypothetical protein